MILVAGHAVYTEGLSTNTEFKKMVCSYTSTLMSYGINGINDTGNDDTITSFPTVDSLFIGHSTASGNLNGHIKFIKYYPKALSSANLVALTS